MCRWRLREKLFLIDEGVLDTKKDMTNSGDRTTGTPDSLTRRASFGFFWNQMSRFGEYGVMFVLSVVLARGLGSTEFGRYTVVVSLAYICILLSTLGLNEALNNYVPKFQDSRGKLAFILKRAVTMRLAALAAVGVAYFVAAPWIAERLGSGQLVPLLRLSLLFIFFASLAGLLSMALFGILRVKTVALTRFIVGVTNVVVAGFAVHAGYGVREVVVLLGLSSLISLVVFRVKLNRFFASPSVPIPTSRLGRFALAVYALSFVNYLVGKQVGVAVMKYLGAELEAVGFFGISFDLSSIVASLLVSGLAGVSLAAFSRVEQTMGARGLGNAWLVTYKLSFVILIPSMVFCFLKAPQIVDRMYGREYLPAAELFRTFLLFYVPVRFLGGGGNLVLLLAAEKQNITLSARAFAGVVCLALYMVLVPAWGARGGVISVGSAIVIAVGIEFFYARRIVSFDYPFSFSAKVLLASLVPAASCFVTRTSALPSIVTSLSVYFALYLAIVIFLRPLNAYDGEVLGRVFPRPVGFARRKRILFLDN